jgi:hypothetical protein
MIRYLNHNQIDRQRWDGCIRNAVNSLVYASSWYLDMVSPGWEALVENDYESVFPLTFRKKFGIHYLYQPYFTQQLGIFSTGLLTEERVTRFLQAIPAKFRYAEIHLNYLNKVNRDVASCEFRLNHELELVMPYEVIRGGYSQNVKRNLKKAVESGVIVHKKMEPDDLITLFRENFGAKEDKLSLRDYTTIRNIISYSIKQASGMLLGAGISPGKQDAGAFFLKDGGRFIMLLAATDYRAREYGPMFFLLDAFIREHSGQPFLLDFEGGNDPGLGRFYGSFGAREIRYPLVRIDRLGWIQRRMAGMWKRLRHS